MGNKISILSTVTLDKRLSDKAAEQGVQLDGIPFIHVAAVASEALAEEVSEFCTRTIAAVFTSANAVRAISKTIKELKPAWDIYCIGHTTRMAVLECFTDNMIKGMANDSAGLAEIIKTDHVPEVVFFCGDKRMDTLPDLLHEAGMPVHELVVYHTLETPEPVAQPYDAILFFSPSSVHSYFTINKVSPDVILFAIGSTTAGVLQQYTGNKVIVSNKPSKEDMITDAISYFHKQARVTTAPDNHTV